tara:strand:- start:17847 stop:18302 length:456 start_codon:yes stop_codon:yes gene_type:complete
MSAKKKAYDTLITAGTNALCDAGLSLDFADVSEKQKHCLVMTEEDGHTAHFSIDGVACVAASKPAGCGEERIVVMYDTNDVATALETVKCAGSLPRGKTAAKCTLERKTGRYIMKQRLSNWFFRTTNEDKHALCKRSIKPLGYTLDGRFIF